eukprot:15446445-Alexandrium_andersonii.AAC.1
MPTGSHPRAPTCTHAPMHTRAPTHPRSRILTDPPEPRKILSERLASKVLRLGLHSVCGSGTGSRYATLRCEMSGPDLRAP